MYESGAKPLSSTFVARTCSPTPSSSDLNVMDLSI
uniref:Uncharacterized protein n=1 Tax=Lepeophtheirus salmonis TaxID=72036 RepID=A0A0K2VFS1_LEPSM